MMMTELNHNHSCLIQALSPTILMELHPAMSNLGLISQLIAYTNLLWYEPT